MIIRTLQHDDLPALSTIIDAIPFYNDYGLSGASVTSQLQTLTDTQRQIVWVALKNDQPVGFAWFTHKGAFGRSHYLRLLAIDPAHQKSGTGIALMRHAESHILSPHGLCLLVTADNSPARQFYSKLGYAHIGTLPDYVRPGRDECIYFKSSRTDDQ